MSTNKSASYVSKKLFPNDAAYKGYNRVGRGHTALLSPIEWHGQSFKIEVTFNNRLCIIGENSCPAASMHASTASLNSPRMLRMPSSAFGLFFFKEGGRGEFRQEQLKTSMQHLTHLKIHCGQQRRNEERKRGEGRSGGMSIKEAFRGVIPTA